MACMVVINIYIVVKKSQSVFANNEFCLMMFLLWGNIQSVIFQKVSQCKEPIIEMYNVCNPILTLINHVLCWWKLTNELLCFDLGGLRLVSLSIRLVPVLFSLHLFLLFWRVGNHRLRGSTKAWYHQSFLKNRLSTCSE
jgi:hypothetical protein